MTGEKQEPPTGGPVGATGGGGATGARVMIAGHLDTVHPPGSSFRELTVSSDGKTAAGPGCVDMKGGLVIAMAALEVLEETGERVEWSLVLNSDEETGSYHSQRAIGDEARRVAGAGGIGIALEPATSDGGLVIERAGSGQFMLETFGKSAHVGRDFASGVSAVDAIAEAVLRVRAFADVKAGVIVNVGPLEGGTATNVVPDHARAWGNVRFPTPEAGEEVRERLEGLATEQLLGARLEVRTSFLRPAKPATEGTMRLAELARDAAGALGQKLPFSKTAGVCDGNVMQAAGLATIDTLGVRGGGLHTKDEWIELASLVERCQLLAIVLMRAGGARG